MQFVFTKGNGKFDQMSVVRDGIVCETIDCPKQGIIPHDMVHFAVESTLHKCGFIGRIASGEAISIQMAAEAESDGVERLVEVFQADGWSGWQTPVQDLIEMYLVTCSARDCPPLPVLGDDIQAVREKILELTKQWQEVAVGEPLVLQFGQAA